MFLGYILNHLSGYLESIPEDTVDKLEMPISIQCVCWGRKPENLKETPKAQEENENHTHTQHTQRADAGTEPMMPHMLGKCGNNKATV